DPVPDAGGGLLERPLQEQRALEAVLAVERHAPPDDLDAVFEADLPGAGKRLQRLLDAREEGRLLALAGGQRRHQSDVPGLRVHQALLQSEGAVIRVTPAPGRIGVWRCV